MARVGRMTKQEMTELKTKGKEFTQKLAAAMDQPIDSAAVQELIAQHYKGIQFFYDCPISVYRGLGQMYVDDPRFTAYYDKFRPGLAVFVRDAITHFCDNQEGNKK
jgi:MerR family transcriptional regulator, multidrug-efflux activator